MAALASAARYMFNSFTSGFSALNLNLVQDSGTMTHPTLEEVGEVKLIFNQELATTLPLEIIDIIIDFAEYWPYTSVESKHSFTVVGRPHGRRPEDSNKLILRTAPLGYNASAHGQEYSIDMNHYCDTRASNVISPFPYQTSDVEHDITAQVLKSWDELRNSRSSGVCRKVVFTLKSYDQGWGGEAHDGEYHGSYTWFDVGKESFRAIRINEDVAPQDNIYQCSMKTTKDGEQVYCRMEPVKPPLADDGTSKLNHPELPHSFRLQSNKRASSTPMEHVITWRFDDEIRPDSPAGEELERQGRGRESCTGDFVRNLKLGDVITIWARARFIGWQNTVESAKIDVYWAV